MRPPLRAKNELRAQSIFPVKRVALGSVRQAQKRRARAGDGDGDDDGAAGDVD